MDRERIEKQFAFLEEIDKEKLIGRQNYLADGSRKENDAEHAWHMALMIILLQEYANEEVDVLRTVTMALLHDVIEIDAGDTYAYDEQAKLDQRERELLAADRIFNLLPEDQAKKMREIWDEFEAQETKEAKFARTMDHIQPLMLNALSGGVSWKEHGVREEQILKRNERTALGSKDLWTYAKEMYLDPNVENGTIIREEK